MVNDFPVLSAGPKPTAPLDQWTLHHPAEDRKLFGDRFAQAIAKVVSAYGTAADPELYGRGAQAAAERAPVHRGHPGGLRLRPLERPLADRQRPGRDVLPGHQHGPVHRGHKESVPFKPAGTFPYVPVTG